MTRIIVSFFLFVVSLNILGQVSPTITITSDKSVINVGETINFTAVFSGGGTVPKFEWKKNGVIVGSNTINLSDNTLKDGDKIACVLTSNDPQRVINVVASNFLSPKVNPIQVNPILTGKAIVGDPIVLNSNQTQQIIWRRNGSVIKNPIKDLIKNGITIAGSPEKTNRIYWPNGIFIDENDDIYIADTYNNRILKQNFKSGLIEVVAGGNGSASQGSPGQSNQVIEPLDIVKDKNGNLIIAGGNRIQIWEPGSVSGKTLISKSAENIFLDKKNNLYLSNQALDQIEKYNLSTLEGEIVAGGNGKGSKDNQLNIPSGIFVDDEENLYVVDNGNYRIQKWVKNSKTGKTIFGGNGSGKSGNQLYYPTDIYVDKLRGIFVTDSYRVVKCDTSKNIGTTILGTDPYGTSNNFLWHVKGISFNSNGEMFVADAYNNRVQKKNLSSGIVTTQIGNDFLKNELKRPSGIAVDTDNSIYVSDNGNNRIQKYNNNGSGAEETVFPLVSNANFSSFGLSQPRDIHIDSLNNLYVADSGNNRILKINLQYNTGSNVAGGNGRGNLLNQLNYPRFFALSKSGNLFVSDNSDTNRIVKWNANSLEGTKIIDGKMMDLSYLNLSAIYLDKNENLYFGANYAIYKLPFNSKVPILAAGTKSYGSGNSNINYATGIVVDDEENIYFLDNNQVKKWAKNAKSAITIIGDVNGGNRSDQLSNPIGMKFDRDGNIFISDTYNHRIQKFIFENNSTFIPTLAGEYTASIITQFGEFITPIFKVTAPDADGDGIEDALDKCPNTIKGEAVDSNGCSLSQKDTDNDGVNDKIDKCSSTKTGFKVDSNGCADYQKDTDNDGITDDLDKCPDTPKGLKVDSKGCSDEQNACSVVKPSIKYNNGTEIATSLTGVNYNWYLNDTLLIESKFPTIIPLKSGKYSIKVLVSDKCLSSMSDYVSVLITSTKEELSLINAFPNPFNKEIKIEFPAEYGFDVKVSISDIKGSIVYSKVRVMNSEILNLSYLSSGTYFLSIIDRDSLLKKLIKLIKE